jgi:signal transduction histidine kinase
MRWRIMHREPAAAHRLTSQRPDMRSHESDFRHAQVAVLGFFAVHRRTEDERWTGVLEAIAAQLGPVLSRKRAEDELSRQAVELARSNADLRLYAELTAHELQQPLHSVVQMLARAIDGVPDRGALLETAHSSARRLQDSIEGLLRYASVGKPEARPVSAEEVVDQAFADLAPELGEAGAELVVRRPLPSVQADPATFPLRRPPRPALPHDGAQFHAH